MDAATPQAGRPGTDTEENRTLSSSAAAPAPPPLPLASEPELSVAREDN